MIFTTIAVMVLGAAAALPAAVAQPPAPCEPQFRDPQLRRAEVQRVPGVRYALAFHAVPAIHVSEFFTLEVAVCAAPGQPTPRTLRVDASMPEHRHGMNYRPSIRPRGPGRFVVEGMLFHMPGRWEFSFEVNAGAASERLTAEVVLR